MEEDETFVPVEGDEPEADAAEATDEVTEGAEDTDEVSEPEAETPEVTIGDAVRAAHAEEMGEGDEPEPSEGDEPTEPEAPAEEPEEEAEEEAEPELYDEDGFPSDLPEELQEFFVDRAERSAGPWKWVAQPGLDIEVPEVQELAYELLYNDGKMGVSWAVAMFGGTKRPENIAKLGRGGTSLGGDGRWFASSIDVVDAAKAHVKAKAKEGVVLPSWTRTRQRGAA